MLDSDNDLGVPNLGLHASCVPGLLVEDFVELWALRSTVGALLKILRRLNERAHSCERSACIVDERRIPHNKTEVDAMSKLQGSNSPLS